MNAPLYTLDILRLAATLPEPVALDRVDGTAEQRSVTCGSVVRTGVRLDAEGRVERFSQQVQACAFGQASASLLAAHAHGRSAAEVSKALGGLEAWLAGSADIPEWPGIAALEPARSRRSRHAAILLPFKSLQAAIEDAGA